MKVLSHAEAVSYRTLFIIAQRINIHLQASFVELEVANLVQANCGDSLSQVSWK